MTISISVKELENFVKENYLMSYRVDTDGGY